MLKYYLPIRDDIFVICWRSTFLSAVDILASVETLGGDHELLLQAVLVAVAESDHGERSASTRVVDDILDDTLDVAVSLGVVHRAELGGALAMERVRLERGTATLSLCSDNPTHFIGFSL